MMSIWTLLWAAVLPAVILAYEVDWKKLDGLARAKVEVRKEISPEISAARRREMFLILKRQT